MLIVLVVAGALPGCYYDPYTGYTYPYPPYYGYPQSQPPGPPPESGGPPPGARPPSGPPPQGDGITRDQYIQRAVQRATNLQRDPQRAAQRAGAVFDQMDVNHTGVVTREEMRAWRAAHQRPPNPGQPPPPPQ